MVTLFRSLGIGDFWEFGNGVLVYGSRGRYRVWGLDIGGYGVKFKRQGCGLKLRVACKCK